MKNVKRILLSMILVVVIQLCFPCDTISATELSASGRITGLQNGDAVNVILYNNYQSYSAATDEKGDYSFRGIESGDYFVKIDMAGYSVPKPVQVKVESAGVVVPDMEVTKAAESDYFYQWKADDTYFGYEETANVVSPWKVEFLDEDVYPSDATDSIRLYQKYKVILSDEEEKWAGDYTSRFYELYQNIPQQGEKKPSKWILTDKHINNDITITYGEEANTVTLSKDVFQNAIPRKAKVNGTLGTFFSNRLYDALVRYVTHDGEDIDAVDYILVQNFGCSIKVPDYEELTAGVTDETAAAFEMFKPEELVAILNMFEEMPSGFHKISGLKYLIRRTDGTKNPIYPDAAAVSWVHHDPGYMEFVDVAFKGDQVSDTFRLVLHEKSHFYIVHRKSR